MSLTICNPARYVQGAGVIKEIGKYTSEMGLGDRALIVGGQTALSMTQSAIAESFDACNITYVTERFRGQATAEEIDRLVAIGKENKVNLIVGVGGGKATDVSKAVSIDIKAPVVIVPTIAATDAACSDTSVIYSEQGAFVGARVRPRSPELVLVGTDIIVKAPIRYLVAGMGDALATKFEAEACHQSGAGSFRGGAIPQSALCMARWSTDTVLEYGEAARKAAVQGIINQAFDDVVEASVYASSVAWENCGLATAHGMAHGFTVLGETKPYLHGEMVGFFTLTQLVLERQPDDLLHRVFNFCHAVALPVTLADIGLKDASKQTLMRGVEASIEEGSFELVRNEPFVVTAQMLYEAVAETDRFGSELAKK
jgi:glycerol dehydrogenase